jgi:hypothetical protein
MYVVQLTWYVRDINGQLGSTATDEPLSADAALGALQTRVKPEMMLVAFLIVLFKSGKSR